MQPLQTPTVVVVDLALQQRLVEALEENTRALKQAHEQLGNTRLYETEAAEYLGVKRDTLYKYRQCGLPFEKVGKIISYMRKDLDAWRSRSRGSIPQAC